MNKRWRNAVTDVAPHVDAKLSSEDHYPIVAKARVKLKARVEDRSEPKMIYTQCTEEQREAFDEAVRQRFGDIEYAIPLKAKAQELADPIREVARSILPYNVLKRKWGDAAGNPRAYISAQAFQT